ncbi:hypothetical protein AWC38_SpisGene8852 [Stylophora pistillata]|uniref:Uncharacterized protein n=1 Tax=Stylophora pistillata TaxID=50429 RepID=A0A2B4SBS1_STYPI|nr:hypothetical protein AWC38_SpisGene8852 [Stylophora pistillata]
MYDDVDAVAGLPASAWFQEIYEAFPDAKVILALRDNEEVWVRSLSKQIQFINTTDGFLTKISLSWLAPFLGSIFAPSEKARSLKENLLVQQMIMASYGSLNWKSTELFKKKYREHNQRVQAVVPKEKLLIFNVKQDIIMFENQTASRLAENALQVQSSREPSTISFVAISSFRDWNIPGINV